MRVIGKMPYRPAEVIEISNDLKTMQEYVGGKIEVSRAFADVDMICNEEGILERLPLNLNFMGIGIFGPVLFVGVKGEEFTDCPNAEWLTNEINRCWVY